MDTTSIALSQPIEAEFPVNYIGKGKEWFPCQVVGLVRDNYGVKLLCLTETDDGMLGAVEVDYVRPVEV